MAPGTAFQSSAGRWLLIVAVAGSGMAFLDGTVVNVALPDIGKDFGASTSALQWILNGYLLTLASLILLGGSLGDRYGRRRVFVLGVGLFTAASLLCAVAPNVELLIGARLLQGIGGALLTPGSLAILEASFRPTDRARAIGAWSGLGGVATAFGPLLGGYLIGAISWRAIFVINLPIGIFVAWAATRHVPESRDPMAGGRIDIRGAALAALGLAGTTYALIEAPGKGASAAILITGIGGLLALVAFFVNEHRSANPMLPLEIFESRQFSAANAVTFVVYTALGGVFFLLVAFLQISMGYTPIEAGAASLPVTLLMLAFSARAGALAQRIGPACRSPSAR
jgi:EmrB/QacA subfamily drug resistance transporter